MVKFAETHATMCLFINNSTNNRHLKEVHCYLCCILKIYLKLFIINDLKCEMETEYAKKTYSYVNANATRLEKVEKTIRSKILCFIIKF